MICIVKGERQLTEDEVDIVDKTDPKKRARKDHELPVSVVKHDTRPIRVPVGLCELVVDDFGHP